MLPKRGSHKEKLPAVVAEGELSSRFFHLAIIFDLGPQLASAGDQIARQKKLSLFEKKMVKAACRGAVVSC